MFEILNSEFHIFGGKIVTNVLGTGILLPLKFELEFVNTKYGAWNDMFVSAIAPCSLDATARSLFDPKGHGRGNIQMLSDDSALGFQILLLQKCPRCNSCVVALWKSLAENAYQLSSAHH
jgi:hypothetical protein